MSAQRTKCNDLSERNSSCGYEIQSRTIVRGDDKGSNIEVLLKTGCYYSEFTNKSEYANAFPFLKQLNPFFFTFPNY